MIVYKVLVDGKAPYTGVRYELPIDNTPTNWLTLYGKVEICRRGFHGWLTFERAQAEIPKTDYSELYDIYEMQLDGDIVQDTEKAAGSKARLIKNVWTGFDPKENYWKERLAQANTVVERLVVYREAEKTFFRRHGEYTYQPCVPAHHDFKTGWRPNRCASCGLSPMWHFGGSVKLLEQKLGEVTMKAITQTYNWELIEAIRLLQDGVPLA